MKAGAWRRWGLVALGLVVGLGVVPQVRARSRQLHVLNPTPYEVTVELPDGPLVVPGGRRAVVGIGAGRHQLRATWTGPGGATEERLHGVALPPGPHLPWEDRDVYVLAPAGAALLVEEEAVYRDGATPAAPRAVLAAPFATVAGVDHAFEPLPEQSSSARARRGLRWVAGRPAAVAGQLPPGTSPTLALDLLEAALRLDPDDDAAHGALAAAAKAAGAEERRHAFLRSGLATRPVAVAWHRRWQDLRRARGEEDGLRAEYAALQEAAPEDAALEYLLGRVEADARVALPRYLRATQLDPKCAWAWHAQALGLAARGDLERAAQAAGQARALRPDDPEVLALAVQIRLCRGEARALVAELEAAQARRPDDPGLQRLLLEALAAADDLPGALAAHERWARAQPPRDPGHRALLSRLTLLELQGDSAALLRELEPLLATPVGQRLRLRALLDLERLDEAEQALEALGPDPLAHLLLALAARGRGDLARAARAHEQAVRQGRAGTLRERMLAGSISAREPTDGARPEETIALAPPDMAIALAVMAGVREPPAAREALAARARALAAGRAIPARIVQRALDATRPR